MGSDPSPATPDPATARSAEEATVHFPEAPCTASKNRLTENVLQPGLQETAFSKTGELQNGRQILFAETAGGSARHQQATTRTSRNDGRPPVRVNTDSALHSRCESRAGGESRRGVGRVMPAARTPRVRGSQPATRQDRPAPGGREGGRRRQGDDHSQQWATIWCTFFVYVSRGMGYRQPPFSSA